MIDGTFKKSFKSRLCLARSNVPRPDLSSHLILLWDTISSCVASARLPYAPVLSLVRDIKAFPGVQEAWLLMCL